MRRVPAYLQGLEAAVGGNAQAFGFSILITVTFGVVSAHEPTPSNVDLLAFAVSGVLAFSLLNLTVAVLLRGHRIQEQPSRVLLLATATDVLAVGAGVLTAVAAVRLTGGAASWLLAPFLAGLTYVVVQSVELAVGLRRSSRA